MLRADGRMMEIARIQSEINRLFENLLELGGSRAEAKKAWMPNADISEGPDSFVVRVELPGVVLSDLALSVDGGNIIIQGLKRPPGEKDSEQQGHLNERVYGDFRRVMALNAPVNTHQAEASLRDGVLKIIFPKVDNRRGGEVRIPVSQG
jgi:HSP20 family protein